MRAGEHPTVREGGKRSSEFGSLQRGADAVPQRAESLKVALGSTSIGQAPLRVSRRKLLHQSPGERRRARVFDRKGSRAKAYKKPPRISGRILKGFRRRDGSNKENPAWDRYETDRQRADFSGCI